MSAHHTAGRSTASDAHRGSTTGSTASEGAPATATPPPTLETSTVMAAAMLSTLTASPNAAVAAATAAYDPAPDNRSSSLSDIGDASDDPSEATPRATSRPRAAMDLDADADADDADNDSEAETERLNNTPRKFTRVGTDTSLLSEPVYTRTPSKLAHTRTIHDNESPPPTPPPGADDATLADLAEQQNPLHSLSLVAAAEAANLCVGGKRKRPSAESSPVPDQPDEPARKRNSAARSSALDGLAQAAADCQEMQHVREELDNAEELDPDERQVNVATDTVQELATVAKQPKPRKGGRRGKRKLEESNYASNEALQAAEAHNADGDGDGDEEHDAVLDEEVAKKKTAIDKLAEIERKFKLFREKLCDEQMAQLERDMEMLKQPNCVHPEYLAMMKCIDERRDEKIAYETRLQEYKQKNLDIITAAERHQMHSQFFQTVRQVREDMLDACNQRVFELQRGRRQLGCNDIDYMIKMPDKRSDQIRQQAAYNLEVSILSGVAKYVGFPAAPDISPARPAEIDQDLRAMKIATRAPIPPPSFRTYNRLSTADEAAAEEQFLQSTPWANPRHPSHQETRFPMDPSRISSYQTPAGQRRMVDPMAPNGSASTIEANSNPPSSNTHHINGRLGGSESPVLHMKRPPTDHAAYTDTPGSNPRNLGMLSRETYGMMSSPAAPHSAHSDAPEDRIGHRWVAGGMRPLHVGPPTAPSSAPGPSRLDGPRAPMAQRNGIGTVGAGHSLFSR